MRTLRSVVGLAVLAALLVAPVAADAGFTRIFQNALQYAGDVVPDKRGGYVLAGTTNVDPGNRNQFGVARITKGGKLDRSFGKNGYVHVQIAGGSFEDVIDTAVLP